MGSKEWILMRVCYAKEIMVVVQLTMVAWFNKTDYMQKNRVSKVFAQSGQNSFASSCDQCNEKNNEIGQFQFIQRSISKSLEFEKQMPSEALLFRNLWLDCEAECLYRRYKTYHYLMEAGIDVNYTNVEDDIKIGS